MLSDESRIIKKAKFTYSPLGKAFEKPIKPIGDMIWILENIVEFNNKTRPKKEDKEKKEILLIV